MGAKRPIEEQMIRIELIEEVKNRGVFRYRVAGLPIEGQPVAPVDPMPRPPKTHH